MSRSVISVVALTTLFLFSFSGCDQAPDFSESLAEASQDTALEHAEKHLDPTYVCPMHPQIVSDEPGTCPVCGMNLVEKKPAPQPSESLEKASQETALEHAEKHLDPTYVCPMHPQIVSDELGTCPICGMNLVEKKPAPSASAAPKPSESLEKASQETALEHAEKHLDPTYVCPMHPQIVSNEPGTCPICGMDLVLQKPAPQTAPSQKQATNESDDLPVISISPAIQQSMGVRTAVLKRGSLSKQIETVGTVTYDEDRLAHVHARAEGWVEKLSVRAEGDTVKRGEALLSMYSPAVLGAQEDFLVSIRTSLSGVNNVRIREGAANRLRLYDLPEYFIKNIEKKGQSQNDYPILAPQSGVVSAIGVREGMYVTPAQELYTIADLSQVWVMVDVFEQQLEWVKVGLPAVMRVPARPEKTWKGKVDYIYPELDPVTRTLKVRLRFANPERELKPNMFARVSIDGGQQHEVLKLPRQALIVTGQRQAVVLALGNGQFQPVEVRTGMQQNDEVEVLSGLKAGDEVVISGQFLIDSESNLQASFLRFQSGQ